MPPTAVPQKEFYTEIEAAKTLKISVERLYRLLDENVFNDGTPRPRELTFRASELVLISFWDRTQPNPKVIRMPSRSA